MFGGKYHQENAKNGISKRLDFEIFWESMPPHPPKSSRLSHFRNRLGYQKRLAANTVTVLTDFIGGLVYLLAGILMFNLNTNVNLSSGNHNKRSQLTSLCALTFVSVGAFETDARSN